MKNSAQKAIAQETTPADGLVPPPAAVPPAAAPGATAAPDAAADAKDAPQQVNIQIHLRKIPLLAELSEEEMARVKAELRIRSYSRRDIVLQKGGIGDSLLFLLTGQLQVIDITEDGRAIGLRILNPGDFFGEIAVINGSARSASVVAMTPVLVALLPAATALHLFAHSPPVARMMLKHLAQKIQRDSEFRALLSIHNTAKRIYAFIELLKKKDEGDTEVVENLPTHQDIANMINTSRETVTRAILALQNQGIVKKDSHRLIIIKPDALQKLTQG